MRVWIDSFTIIIYYEIIMAIRSFIDPLHLHFYGWHKLNRLSFQIKFMGHFCTLKYTWKYMLLFKEPNSNNLLKS